MSVSVPRAICAKCNIPMKTKRIGVWIAGVLRNGRTYFKVASDLWECPKCKAEIFTGYGQAVESFETGFAQLPTDVIVTLEP